MSGKGGREGGGNGGGAEVTGGGGGERGRLRAYYHEIVLQAVLGFCRAAACAA